MGQVTMTLYDYGNFSYLSVPLSYAQKVIQQCNISLSPKSVFCQELNLAHFPHNFSDESDAGIFCNATIKIKTDTPLVKVVKASRPKSRITEAYWEPIIKER